VAGCRSGEHCNRGAKWEFSPSSTHTDLGLSRPEQAVGMEMGVYWYNCEGMMVP
jgi:hypothetical protein